MDAENVQVETEEEIINTENDQVADDAAVEVAETSSEDKVDEEEVLRLDTEDMYRAIEAVLFATGESVTYERLAGVFNITVKEIKTVVSDMVPLFSDRGIELLVYDKSCQLVTKAAYEDIIKDVLGIRKNGALSNSCLETLAIIAYNQPVTRSYVDEVRGVDSSYAIGILAQRELITVKGKLDVPGKPNLYGTTDNFLRVFGLNSLKDLPEISVLNPDNGEEPIAANEINENDILPLETPLPEVITNQMSFDDERMGTIVEDVNVNVIADEPINIFKEEIVEAETEPDSIED